jgi:hypothetical protein
MIFDPAQMAKNMIGLAQLAAKQNTQNTWDALQETYRGMIQSAMTAGTAPAADAWAQWSAPSDTYVPRESLKDSGR